jgi:two-component system nitrogen regulation response regulator NtrX
MPASILIVDDEKGIRESLGALLRDEGYTVDVAGSGEECLEVVDTRHYDLVMLDIWLPKLDGLETLERIQEQEAPPMVVVISGHANIETAVRAT